MPYNALSDTSGYIMTLASSARLLWRKWGQPSGGDVLLSRWRGATTYQDVHMSTGSTAVPLVEQHLAFRPPQLAVIVPSYNERDNIELLYEKVAIALGDTPWEMIVVDD